MKFSKLKLGVIGLGFAIVLGVFLPKSVHASKSSVDLSTLRKDYKCSDSSKEYHFSGSTKDHNITVDCKGQTVTIYLENATIDMLEGEDKKSESKPAINIKNSTNAIIYIVGNNVLEGGNKTKLINRDGYAGIQVEEGSSVTILGNGSVTVKGGGNDHGAAGIGAEYDKNCGMITIGDKYNCPTIDTTGGDGGAGIGGSEDASCKKGIYIRNGIITATGKNGGAGIGAGDGVATGSGGNVDTIIITGGTITATGGSGAAGIGGSDSGIGGGSGDASNITIAGGIITATGGNAAAGIGGGRDALVSYLTITGGTITATGGKYGAGIGGGNRVGEGDGGDVKALLITGGTITANGGESAAGIGGGDQSVISGLEIYESGNNLNITATGGKWGAGIGNGNSGIGSNNVDKISIILNGGTITATGGSQGAGIGGGNSIAKEIFISGKGTINATGYDESCAIGSGEKEAGGTITIEGISNTRALTINAKALATKGNDNDAAVIGSADSECGTITIKNTIVNLTSVSGCYGAGIGVGKNQSLVSNSGKNIIIENCYIKDNTSWDRYAVSIGAGSSSKMDNIFIKNSEVYGGAIGGSDNTNQLFDFKCIGDITIEGSTVVAQTRHGHRAAIGSSVYSGVGTITITDSNITATTESGAGIGSGGYTSQSEGELFRWIGCAAGDIYITGSTVTATGGNGGAGIGGGWGTEVGSIFIENSNVTAKGGERGQNVKQGGAGIGGGHCESLAYISVKNSTVTATGGNYAAGIGSGGNDTSATTMWNTSCGYMYFEKSKITAKGGGGAAGIGTGYGAQFYDSGDICIISCDVTANGGQYGAGIGAGSNGWAGAGGEAPDISISGDSKVIATGGEGAAGIGGGFDGGCDSVEISLSETTYLGDDNWLYYVKAYGGKGAAGIGSGGVNAEDEVITNGGHDIDKVKITGGYVFAKGGDDFNGAGAGIGGGARGGNIKGFEVTGGYVVGQAGYASVYKNKAHDIGTGGCDVRSLYEDENFKITGGTVIGNLSEDPDNIIIDGGSVSENISNAKRTDGTKVYQTRMETKNPFYKINNLKTSCDEYGTADVFSDGNKIVYLYLPATGTDSSTADFENNHYHGTTTTDGKGWIKMDLNLTFAEPDTEPVVGNCIFLKLNDSEIKGDIEFVSEGDSVQIYNGSHTVTVSPGAVVRLDCKDFGEFTVKATTQNQENNMYWDATAIYKGKVTRKQGRITYVECLSKRYDGEPVKDPTVKTESDGEITFKFYQDNVYMGDGVRPVDCGSYSVIACVAGTENYTAVESNMMYFEITRSYISLEMRAVENGDTATVTVEVLGPYNDPGEVTLSVDGGNTYTLDVAMVDGRYLASHTFDMVGATSYTVTASYADTRNYRAVNEVTKTFDKNLANRTLTVDDIEVTYGDNTAPTTFSVSPSEGNVDNCTYEVVYDMDKLNSNFADTITINELTGEITYLNAGIAYVKITMADPLGVYDDAVAYAKVIVKRKPISVSSYAYLTGDDSKTPVDTVKYGEINTLSYGLKYGGSNDIPADMALVGSLEAIPINETYGVNSDARIAIGQVHGEVVVNGESYNTFISRNYLITYVPGTVTITPTNLWITAEESVGIYGEEPQYIYHFGRVDGSENLMPWDSSDVIVDDVVLTGGQDYADLAPGIYDEIIVTNVLNNPNYIVTIEAGDLLIKKGLVDLSVTAETKIYDKEPVAVTNTANPVLPENAPAGIVKEIGAISVKYYKINSDGTVTELDNAPVDVGNYYVKTKVAETEYYEASENITYFRILKAYYDIDTPLLDDIYMKDGLVISEQVLPEGWVWINPEKPLEIGPMYGYAIFTPENSGNYYPVVREIDFEVLDPNATPDVDVNVGAMLLLIKICFVTMVASLVAIIIIIIKRKKK